MAATHLDAAGKLTIPESGRYVELPIRMARDRERSRSATQQLP